VNFQQGPDAARAIDVLNFQVVNGKPIRIMYSQRDPALRKSGVGNIFIKNLDKDIDNKALYDTFAQFGNIVSAKVATDSQGQSKGYGFVQFDTAEAADGAISKVNGMLMNDKQVYVGPFQRRGERGGGPSTFNNVYVKNLHENVTEDMLREVFEKCGTLTSVVVMKDGEGKSKGFGFVCFEESEAASKAVEDLDGYDKIEDKAWIVCRAQKKAEREAELKAKFDAERRERMEKMAGANLYIKNLEDTVDDAKLRELFAEFGTITSCRVMRDTAGARYASRPTKRVLRLPREPTPRVSRGSRGRARRVAARSDTTILAPFAPSRRGRAVSERFFPAFFRPRRRVF
jgi:polyadenylate-binding protein